MTMIITALECGPLICFSYVIISTNEKCMMRNRNVTHSENQQMLTNAN